MVTRRDSKGKFTADGDIIEAKHEKSSSSLKNDLKNILNMVLGLWRMLPLIVIILILWKYFGFSLKINILIKEITNELCPVCPSFNKTFSTAEDDL